MNDIFNPENHSPLQLLERLVIEQRADQEKHILERKDGEKKIYRQIGQLVHQFWHLKSLLLQQQFPSETGQAIGIYLKNFEMILEKMNLALREARPAGSKMIPAGTSTSSLLSRRITSRRSWWTKRFIRPCSGMTRCC